MKVNSQCNYRIEWRNRLTRERTVEQSAECKKGRVVSVITLHGAVRRTRARVMRARRCGRAAGRGVRSRVQWTTRRRTRSRRMINNENTAKQTVARGWRGRRASQSSDAARSGRDTGAAPRSRPTTKIDARSATGIQYNIDTRKSDIYFLSVTSLSPPCASVAGDGDASLATGT